MAATSRKICNVTYRLGEARISEETPDVEGRTEAVNNSNKEANISVSIEYAEKKSYGFNNSSSAADGVPTTLHAGIPLIVGDDSILISHEVAISPFQWGNTTATSSTKAVVSGLVRVKPNTVADVTYAGTKANCVVPFSYTQEDTFANGHVDVADKTDGIFNGSNAYNLGFAVHT